MDISKSMQEEIVIQGTGHTAPHVPKYRYRKRFAGQLNFIAKRCNERGICAEAHYDVVEIFSNRKVEQFEEVVRESYLYPTMEQPVMVGNSLMAREGKSILGVLVKKDGVIYAYTTEKHFKDMKFFVYVKQLPEFNYSKIFPSSRDMIQALMDDEHIIV